MKRREFLKTAGLTAAAVGASRLLPAAETPEHLQAASSSNAPALMKRTYGRSDEKLSIIGFSGLALAYIDQDYSNRLVAESVEKGVNYFDVAPAYGRGKAETQLGPALEPYRKNVFLACKTYERTREGAKQEFERSLDRLKTDHLDLYQMHNIQKVDEDVDRAFMKDGAVEYFKDLKKEGRIRHLGFSAHTEEAALAALERYDFDSLLFPWNFASMEKTGFGKKVLEAAQKKGTACIALKSCVRAKWTNDDQRKQHEYGWCWYKPLTDAHEQELGLRYTLSRPIMAALPPMAASLYRRALDNGLKFKPITEAEEKELVALAQTIDPLFPR